MSKPTFFSRALFPAIFLLWAGIAAVHAQDGFAWSVTGGTGGQTMVAKTAADFVNFVTGSSTEKRIIYVEGRLEIGMVRVSSNRTIIGQGHHPTLVGTLSLRGGSTNIVIKNLNFTNPMNAQGVGGGDGITIRGGKWVWVDHCTFSNCADGCIDSTAGTDKVTISWCKFFYTDQLRHRFTMLAMGDDKDPKKKTEKLHITLHHNWWAEGCGSRMPAARDARLHMYNNYFSCSGNSYCTDARDGTELLSQNNYYEGVNDPCYGEDGSRMTISGNLYHSCTGKIAWDQTAKVFVPQYPYSLDAAVNVPQIVRAGAGADVH